MLVDPSDPLRTIISTLIVPGQARKRLGLNPLESLADRVEQLNLAGRFVAYLGTVVIEPSPLFTHGNTVVIPRGGATDDIG